MPLTLFDGLGGEYTGTILAMGRSSVSVSILEHIPIEREAAKPVTLALGVPTNERMDWLVEKATELGVSQIQPLMTQRSVMRLSAERAEKKVAHWQAIAIAACEQCGRNRVPVVLPMGNFHTWLPSAAVPETDRLILSFQPNAKPIWVSNGSSISMASPRAALVLSGAEGGLAPAEEAQALAAGFQPVTLGPRVLRAETAAIAALTALTMLTTPKLSA
jgi:16S rRNA (uracil1498-N3)-methyltransferase